ncbi:deoxyuridine 5'-triphosphate nucleotidohydrolase-like [Nyctibius grandis]|uniref:deoxyuridine 5'-triphosphate nucleotidohydrolase-like n=1 Tax=Nyctibius grandis TaxID=48427 RepID=UPI0035BBD398
MGRDDTTILSSSLPHSGCLSELSASTRGSAGVDLAVGSDVTITDSAVHVIPSTVSGLLGYGLSGLLLGRSSATKQGLLVLPGVIDADYTGQIGIMLRVLNPPVTLKQGTRIAQLVPFRSSVPRAVDNTRGNQGFGSTGAPTVTFVHEITAAKLCRTVNREDPGT